MKQLWLLVTGGVAPVAPDQGTISSEESAKLESPAKEELVCFTQADKTTGTTWKKY